MVSDGRRIWYAAIHCRVAGERPSAIVARISAYIAVAILCVFGLREARAAKPNKNGWWGTIGAILGFLIGQQAMLCLAFLQHFPVNSNRKDSQSVRDERVFRH